MQKWPSKTSQGTDNPTASEIDLNDFEDDQSGLEDRFLKDLDFCLRDVESPDPIPLPANPDEIPLPNDGETRPGSPEPGPSFQSPVFKRPVARIVIFMSIILFIFLLCILSIK